jgi:hypothetical protein
LAGEEPLTRERKVPRSPVFHSPFEVELPEKVPPPEKVPDIEYEASAVWLFGISRSTKKSDPDVGPPEMVKPKLLGWPMLGLLIPLSIQPFAQYPCSAGSAEALPILILRDRRTPTNIIRNLLMFLSLRVSCIHGLPCFGRFSTKCTKVSYYSSY